MDLTIRTDRFEDAARVRKAVFMQEQGFQDEFDEVDDDPRTVHITAYDAQGTLVGCARIFPSALEKGLEEDEGRWVFGRLAVLPEMRSHGLGSAILKAGEDTAAEHGARELQLHAQCRAASFYERAGYVGWGPVEYDEHVEHRWMKKGLS